MRSLSALPLTLLIVGAIATACDPEPPPPVTVSQPSPSPTNTGPTQRAIALKEAGINPAWLDKSADACRDFYQLACGGLLATTEIPADQSRWGPDQELTLATEQFLRGVLENAAKAPSSDPVEQKLGAWYGACLDEPAVEAAGLDPIRPLLAFVDRVKDRKSLYKAIAELHRASIFPLFSIGSQQDFKDATRVIAGLDQDGLGLPDRDYYLDQDDKTKDTRAFYVGHLERMFVLAGDKPKDAKREAEETLAVETALAKLAQDKVVRRDPYKIYNKVDRKGLVDAAKGFPWDAYFAKLGFPDIQDVSINSVAYFQGLDALLAKEKLPALRSYLRARVLAAEANRLTRAFVAERFSLRQRLSGQKENEPRWRRCVKSTDAALGELLAQAYVKARFDAASKASAADVLARIRAAMKVELGSLAWMDDATRAAAQEKLARMNDKVGYPARWKSYDFEVKPASYAANALASDVFELTRSLRKVGRPLDREEWQMTPPTVNAYYDSSMNEMVFPAGILQPPYFDKSFAAVVNFGATGAVMGHELTHGFDDEGSQFDALGNLRNWWTKTTAAQFKEQTKCVADQYSAYEALPGVKLNGELTLGENIADIGGVKLALSAYRDLAKSESQHLTAEGYDEAQLFFLAFGQSWCEKARPEFLELLVKTNPHSPPRFRVNGVLQDVPAFAEAFACGEGSVMRPAKVCAVW